MLEKSAIQVAIFSRTSARVPNDTSAARAHSIILKQLERFTPR
jgi:hypothetical protein